MAIGVTSALEPKGYARYSNLSTVKLLTDAPDAGVTLPAGADYAVMSVKDQAIRIRSDGTSPTATEGLYIPAGTTRTFENCRTILTVLKMIEVAATAEVTIEYFDGAGG